jgi:N-formylglutamate amidohydrolase
MIDCHSYSSKPTVLCDDEEGLNRYDVCIGFNNNRTNPGSLVIGIIANYFKEMGYEVGINTLFPGTKEFNVPVDYKSVKIAFNKRLYMDEETLGRKPEFETLHKQILGLYNKLLRKTISSHNPDDSLPF